VMSATFCRTRWGNVAGVTSATDGCGLHLEEVEYVAPTIPVLTA
jgi:hypothetical protein